MADPDLWSDRNAQYIAAAVEWLRSKLLGLAQDAEVAADPAAQPVDPPAPRARAIVPTTRWLFPSPTGASVSLDTAALPPPSAPRTLGAADVDTREARMDAAAEMDPPPALLLLQQRLGLCDFERSVVLLCAAVELNTTVARLCAAAQDDPGRPYPTLALAYALWPDAPWAALAPDGKLRAWRLIEINQPGSTPLMAASLRADEKIVSFLKGLNHLDDRLQPLLTQMAVPDGPPPPSHQALVDRLAAQLRSAAGVQPVPVHQLVGPDAASKQAVAAGACAALGLPLLRVALSMLPGNPAELETFITLWQREVALVPRGLYVEAHDVEGHLPALQRMLARTSGPVFCAVRDRLADVGRESTAWDVARPTVNEQQAEWRAAIGEEAGEMPGELAAQFVLNVPDIRRIAREASVDAGPGAPPLRERIWRACAASTRPQLEVLAQRIEPRVRLADVVLPKEHWDSLALIASQVKSRTRVYDEWGFRAHNARGLGISALFAGESGTGKTMAAEALASELALDLYRIDLSAVVNKYIGETEKNLRRLFDAAEDGGAILFFDEADALFGKRTEVKDSHDRYANIEINYLLQRLEAFQGLAILATNMRSALDTAFTRRLRFVVSFPFPGIAEREAIWRRAFPGRTPVADDLDVGRLAKLHLTGANIQSIALNAAFLAAQAGEPAVGMRRVLGAARAEFRKFDWPVNDAEFQIAQAVGAHR